MKFPKEVKTVLDHLVFEQQRQSSKEPVTSPKYELKVTYRGVFNTLIDDQVEKIVGSVCDSGGYFFHGKERDMSWLYSSKEEADKVAQDLRHANISTVCVEVIKYKT